MSEHPSDRVFNVLFLCTGEQRPLRSSPNKFCARKAPAAFHSFSAGSQPRGDHQSVRHQGAAERAEYPTDNLRSKS